MSESIILQFIIYGALIVLVVYVTLFAIIFNRFIKILLLKTEAKITYYEYRRKSDD